MIRKQNYIRTLEIDSLKWPELETLKDNIVVPSTVLHQQMYLDRLAKIAMLAELGDHKGMELALNDEETIKEKNQLLRPLYSDIKLIIRQMSRNEENEILRDFHSHAGQILSSFADDEEKIKAIDELQVLYAKVIQKKIDAKTPIDTLQEMSKQLNNLFKLMIVWHQYVEIIYMPANEIEMMKLKRQNPQLFTKDFDNQSIGDILRRKEEKGYYSVEEAVTTDTHETEKQTDAGEAEGEDKNSIIDSMINKETQKEKEY